MATSRAFNLTAQLNLRGPTNIGPIVSNLRNQLSNISANVTVNVAPNAATNVAALNTRLTALNATLLTTRNNAQAAAGAIQAFAQAVNAINVGNIPQQITAVNNAINTLGNNNRQTAQHIRQSRTEMEEFGRQAGLAIRRFAAFSVVGAGVMSFSRSLDSGVKAFIEYDKQLVKLQQVTGQTAVGLRALTREITNLSTNFGVSSSDLTEVASTLAQAGLSARDTEKALKALALSALAPSFDSMNETVEGSIALMRQFDIGAGDLEKALSSINEVAAKFAVEASDIVTAIQRTGGVFATASKGVSTGTEALNEFIAVFTSVRATTRESAETIATGLRTIFSRIQRGDTIQALKEYGVNLTDLDGKFVGAYRAVEELSKGLSRIDPRELRFSQITEELGGFRQIGKVIPLIQQFAVTQEALRTAQKGQGSLARDAATAQLSLANQIAKVREQFLALFREIGGSNTFQTISRGALNLASNMIKIADSMKEVLPVLGIMFAFRGASAAAQFGSGFMGAVRGNQRRASGGYIQAYAGGGTVNAMLMPGEAVIAPNVASRIGKNKLDKLNHAEKYAGGGGVKFVPGQGNSDSFGPVPLEVGSYVLRKDAVKKLGRNNVAGLAGYAKGGPVTLRDLQKEARIPYNNEIQEEDAVSGNITRKPFVFDQSNKEEFENLYRTRDRIYKDLKAKNPNAPKNVQSKLIHYASGLAFEEMMASRIKGERSASSTAPIDIKMKNGTPVEVKFTKQPVSMAHLLNKLLRFKIQQYNGKVPGFSPGIDDNVNLGQLLVEEAGEGQKKLFDSWADKVSATKNERKRILRYAKGGEVFGGVTGVFPKRVINAYKTAQLKRMNLEAWDKATPQVSNERIMVDEGAVAKQYDEPFDRAKALSTFGQLLNRNSLVTDLSDFARLIGIPKDALTEFLPRSLDFGGSNRSPGAFASFDKTGKGGFGLSHGTDLEEYGYGQAHKEAIFGYEYMLEESKKKMAKILKKPNPEYDPEFKTTYETKAALVEKIHKLKQEKKEAILGAEEDIEKTRGSRGAITFHQESMARLFRERIKAPREVLFHEMTHQMMKTLTDKTPLVFENYKKRISQLFEGDNDDVEKMIDALPPSLYTGNYTSADMAYGRAYKLTAMSNVMSGSYGIEKLDPANLPAIAKLHGEAEKITSARAFKPLNNPINDILKKYYSPDYVSKLEDNSKEEFITTLVQKMPVLNTTLSGILQETLSSLFGDAGIQRQNFAAGGMVQRKLGILDTDVIMNPANEKIVLEAMAAMGIGDKRKYKQKLSAMAAEARVSKNLGSYKILAGVAGTGKSSLATARGQDTTAGTLRTTTRFPILTPEDLKKATDVIDITSTTSKEKIDSYIKYADKTMLLSTSTPEEQTLARERRGIRDVTGVGLYGRNTGATRGAPIDSATMEAMLASSLGPKLKVLGLQNLKQKKGQQLVSIEEALMDLYFGSFSPMQKGHEERARMAKAEGPGRLPYVLVGSNEAISRKDLDDPHSARTLAFPQNFRTLLARAALSAEGISVMPKTDTSPGVPGLFELPSSPGEQRRFVRSKTGSIAHTQGKDVEKTKRMYAAAGFGLKNIEARIGGFSGTGAREAVLSGNIEAMQEMLSPSVFEIINRNLIPLQNRANIAPRILANHGRRIEAALQQIDAELSGLPQRITKKKIQDPAFFAQAQRVIELRKKRERLKSGSFAPHKIMEKLAKRYPEYYGLETGLAAKSLFGQMEETDVNAWIDEFFPQMESQATALSEAKSSELLTRYAGAQIPDEIFNIDPTAWHKRKQINKVIDADVIQSVNRAKYSDMMSPTKVRAFSMLRDWMIRGLAEVGGTKASAQEAQRKQTISAIQQTKKLAIVGIDPMDLVKTEGPMKLGGENVTIFMRGLPGKYKDIIKKLRVGYESVTTGAAQEILQLQGGKRKIRNLSEAEKMAAGKAGAEGGMLEFILGKLGARGGTVQNRAIDYPYGLGPGALAFPGIGSNWPTEAKRTLNAKNITDAKNEFARFFSENKKETTKKTKKVKKMAQGGEVPIMAQEGEYVINRASAQQIGYHNLDRLNKYHTGGKVKGYARGGSINSFTAGDEPFTGRNLLASAADREAMEGLVTALQQLGVTSSESANLIRRGAQISAQAAQQAMRADVERARTAGASAEQIAQAEARLIASRLQSSQRQRTKNTIQSTLETGLSSNLGAGTMGGLQQQIESGAEQAFRQLIDDLETQLRNVPVGMQLPEEQIQQRLTDVTQLRDFKEQAYRETTNRLTGSNLNVGQGEDVMTFINESKQNRQLLAQMDAEYTAIRRRELAMEGTAANEIERTINQELTARRNAANAAAREQGSRGPGRTGIIGNIQNIAYGGYDIGARAINTSTFGRITNTLGGAVTNNAGYFLGMGVSMLGTQAENMFGKKDSSASAARKVARTEQLTGTIGAGLSLAGGLASIPGIGTFAAGVTVLGTALYTATDFLTDFTGNVKNAANEFEAGIRAKNIAKATTDVEKAMEALQKDFNNADLRKGFDEASKARTKLVTEDFRKNVTAVSERMNPAGFFRGITRQGPAKLTDTKIEQIAQEVTTSDAAKQNETSARQFIETKIQQGMNLEGLSKNKELWNQLSEQILQTDKEFAKIVLSGDQVAINNKITAKSVELLNDPALKAAEKAKQMSDAMDAADKAGRRLAMSFERISDSITQSIDAAMFEFDRSLSDTSGFLDSLSGQPKIQSDKSEAINILKNPKAYSEAKFTESLREAANVSSAVGGDKRISAMITGSAELGRSLSDAAQKAVREAVGRNASISIEDVKMKAMEAGQKEIDRLDQLGPGLPEDVKKDLMTQLRSTVNASAEKAKKDEGKIDVDAFDEELKKLGDSIGQRGREIAIKLLEFKDNAVNRFVEAINDSTKNVVEANKYTARALEIGVKSGFEMRQTVTGVGPSFDELAAVKNARIASLAGGLTNPVDIFNRKLNLSAGKTAIQEQLNQAKKINNIAGAEKLAENIKQWDLAIMQADEALREFADDTQLASAALDELKTIMELQKQTIDSTKKVLSTGPKELKQQFDAMARIRFMMAGGTIVNTRQAQRAFTDTLRSTGDRRQAEIARQDVLAQQRAEEQQTFERMKPIAELQMRNRGMTADQIDQQMRRAEANMMMAQGRAAGIDVRGEAQMIMDAGNASPAAQAAKQKFATATGFQIQANELLAREQQTIADRKLILATQGLTEAFINATNMMNAAFAADKAVENPLNLPAVAAPVAPGKAKGGIIYASRGTLVNYEPQGTDTVPAMLTPGEFVVNARATAQNLPLLQALNREHGGVVYLQRGGRPIMGRPIAGQAEFLQNLAAQTPTYNPAMLRPRMNIEDIIGRDVRQNEEGGIFAEARRRTERINREKLEKKAKEEARNQFLSQYTPNLSSIASGVIDGASLISQFTTSIGSNIGNKLINSFEQAEAARQMNFNIRAAEIKKLEKERKESGTLWGKIKSGLGIAGQAVGAVGNRVSSGAIGATNFVVGGNALLVESILSGIGHYTGINKHILGIEPITYLPGTQKPIEHQSSFARAQNAGLADFMNAISGNNLDPLTGMPKSGQTNIQAMNRKLDETLQNEPLMNNIAGISRSIGAYAASAAPEMYLTGKISIPGLSKLKLPKLMKSNTSSIKRIGTKVDDLIDPLQANAQLYSGLGQAIDPKTLGVLGLPVDDLIKMSGQTAQSATNKPSVLGSLMSGIKSFSGQKLQQISSIPKNIKAGGINSLKTGATNTRGSVANAWGRLENNLTPFVDDPKRLNEVMERVKKSTKLRIRTNEANFSMRNNRPTITLPTNASQHVIQHEMGHAIDFGTGMFKGSTYLTQGRLNAKQLKAIEDFLKSREGYSALQNTSYSAKQLLGKKIPNIYTVQPSFTSDKWQKSIRFQELFAELVGSVGTKSFSQNKQAQEILRMLMKIQKFSYGGIVHSPAKYLASGGIVSPARYSGGGHVRASAAMINNGVSSNRSVNINEQLEPIYKALGGLLDNHAAAFGGQIGNLNSVADRFQQAFGMVAGGIAVNHSLTAQHNHSGHLNTLQQNIEDKTTGLVSDVIATMRRSSDGGLDQMLGMDSNQIIGKSKYT